MAVDYLDIDEPTQPSGVQYLNVDAIDSGQDNALWVFGSEFGKGIGRGFLNVGSGLVEIGRAHV